MTAACYYELLGVARNASSTDIKRAFRQAALRWHPDKNPTDREAAEQRFKELTLAYEVLGDPRRRAEYELHGACKPPAPKADWTDAAAAKDLLEDFFSMFGEANTACTAAEALLAQMGSLSFANAMVNFCQHKMDQTTAAFAGRDVAQAPPEDVAPHVAPATQRAEDEYRPTAVEASSPAPQPTKQASEGAPVGGVTSSREVAGLAANSVKDEPQPASVGVESSKRQRWCDVEEDDAFMTRPRVAPATSCQSSAKTQVCDDSTLRGTLQELQAEDQECVLLVRGINRLGFGSQDILVDFFKPAGNLKKVLVTHSKVKATGKRRERIRPAALGFVILTDRRAVERELSYGEHREINGFALRFQSFKHSSMSEDMESS